MKRIAMHVAFVVLAAACGGDERAGTDPEAAPAVAAPAGPAEVTFAPELGIDLAAMTRLPDGVYVQDVETGGGPTADSTSSVTVEYRAWLPDGTLFEQRPDAGEGFGRSEFVLNQNAPVPGLASGISGMRVGGVRRVVVPPEHGYDLIGRPPAVPADAVVVFEIRLKRVAS